MSRTSQERKAYQDGYFFTGIYFGYGRKAELQEALEREKKENPHKTFRQVDIGSGTSVYYKYKPYKAIELEAAKNKFLVNKIEEARLDTSIKNLMSQIETLKNQLGNAELERSKLRTETGEIESRLKISVDETSK